MVFFLFLSKGIKYKEFMSKSSSSLIAADEGNNTVDQYPVHKQALPQYASCTDLEMTEDEADSSPSSTSRKVPPAPWQLTMEAQHNKAVVIGWTSPEEADRLVRNLVDLT